RSSCLPGQAELEQWALALADFSAERKISVFGENDRKPNGHWPGRQGALNTATELAKRLGRPVQWSLPPGEAKDLRAWCLSRALPFNGPNNQKIWHDAGAALLELLEINSVDAAGGLPTIVITLKEMEVND